MTRGRIVSCNESKAYLELQFGIAHAMAVPIGGESMLSLPVFAGEISKNKRAQAYIDRVIREQVADDTYHLFGDRRQFLESIIASLHKHYQWAAHGFGVFDISHGLLQRLRLTDPSSAPVVPMPFDTFLIRIAPGTLILGEHDVRWIWVHRYEPTLDSGEVVLVEPVSEMTMERPFCFQAPWADLFKLNITVVEERNGEDAIVDVDPVEISNAKVCAVVAANLCFYILSASGQQEASAKPPSPGLKRRAGKTWPRCWALGKSVPIDPRLDEALDGGPSTGKAKLKFKHIVRGHWRNQACGKDRLERRVIWIQPYWKGPDVEEAWTHAYKIRE
jgi:hypothetical protein